jgi:hypothetical protein
MSEENFLAQILRNRCLATDPIGMEFLVEAVDPAIRNQLMALRFQTIAKMYNVMAEGASQAAKIVGQGK